jgi:protein-S-isoprenylcysteine O-methyltransferase Ste14
MLWVLVLILPLIVLSNLLSGSAYAYPDALKTYVTQSEFVQWWVSLNILIVGLYCIACLRSQINRAALWVALPCILAGAVLLGSGYARLGPLRTFFGREFGLVGGDPVASFPFTLAHPQYKGAILLIVGIWLAFRNNLELTAVTGIWVLSFLVQVFVEEPPVFRGPSRPSAGRRTR